MSKKIFHVFVVLTGAALFLSFSIRDRSDNDDPELKYEKILREVGVLLEQGHYSPKKIDDAFSKLVLKKFTEELDDDRNIFIQSDIEGFRKYENKIDDEIHGAELESFFTINDLYLKRLNETSGLFNDILAMPFDYSKDETVELEQDKLSFPRSEEERKENWRKRLKYLALSKYVEMQADREKNKDKKDFVAKPDTALEREARLAIKKQIERFFATKKTHETTEENFSTFVNVITGSMDPHTSYRPPVDKRLYD